MRRVVWAFFVVTVLVVVITSVWFVWWILRGLTELVAWLAVVTQP